MLEIVVVAQTVIVSVILIAFIAVLFKIKSEISKILSEVEKMRCTVTPTINAAKEALDCIKNVASTANKGVENIVVATEKIKQASEYVESLTFKTKTSAEVVKNSFQLYKKGLAKGFSAFVSYYINKNKRKED